MNSLNPIIQSWLSESFLTLLVLGGMSGIFIGLLLIFDPQRFHRISSMLDRWVSTRALDKALERNITLDPWLYRYRRATGALILAGALFILYYFAVELEREAAIVALAKRFHYPASLTGGLLDALVLSALLGAFCATFVALCLMFRPSLLRGFEASANQWLSLRKALKPMEIPRDYLNDFVAQHTRRVGIFLLIGGVYILALLSWWFARL